MSVIQRTYFDIPDLLPHDLPVWFDSSKYRKIVKVIGATVRYK
jgi:hypothetical protein